MSFDHGFTSSKNERKNLHKICPLGSFNNYVGRLWPLDYYSLPQFSDLPPSLLLLHVVIEYPPFQISGSISICTNYCIHFWKTWQQKRYILKLTDLYSQMWRYRDQTWRHGQRWNGSNNTWIWHEIPLDWKWFERTYWIQFDVSN